MPVILASWLACYWIGPADLAARADQDGDGHAAEAFGGDDCDDSDPTVVTGCDAPPGHTADSGPRPTPAHTGPVGPAHTGDGPHESACADARDDDDDGDTDCADADCADDPACAPLLRVNEILASPDPGLLGDAGADANCDGDGNVAEDEFVELLNVGRVPVALAGGTLSDRDAVRFAFPGNADPLDPGAVLVVFGGGTWGRPGGGLAGSGPWCRTPPAGARIYVADGGLSLDRLGDRVTFALPDLSLQVDYSNAPNGASLNRDPDGGDGPFVPHGSLAGATEAFSPLRRVDLTAF